MAEREGLVRVWARRAVSFPLYVVVGSIYLMGWPIGLATAALVDVVRGDRRFPRARRRLLRALLRL